MNCCLHCTKGSDFKESNCLNNHFYKDNDIYFFLLYYVIVASEKKILQGSIHKS